jgi:peptide subunit release factor 1 (eRF1)
MTVPSMPMDVHHRYSPEVRDRILQRLRSSMDTATYRLLTPAHLKALSEIESPDARVVSVYLRLTPERRARGAWRSAFSSMVDAVLKPIDDRRARAALRTEFERIENTLQAELPALSRGVVFFVSQRIGLWRQIALPLPLPDRIHVGARPHIRPLVRTRDEHDQFVLAILSQQNNRLFIGQIGLVREVFQIRSDRLGRMLGGRIENDRRDDIMTQAIKHEARILANAAQLTLAQFGARYLLLAGWPELRAEVVRDLPKDIQARVDRFAVEIHAGAAAVAAAAEPTQRAIEARGELDTVQRLIEAGPARAVWGVESTLAALRAFRVITLVVDDMFGQTGARCGSCGALFPAVAPNCPSCRSDAVEPIYDVVELAIEQALHENAALELVRSEPARRLLAERGPMAALLRW